MDAAYIEQALKSLSASSFTKAIHRKPYPAISPTRPELSQAGKVVLVPGGGTSVGLSIARGFTRAGADKVIIIGRRGGVLTAAAAHLEGEAAKAGTSTKILHRVVDVVDLAQVDAFWDWLAAEKIFVDVWVANVAKGSDGKPLLALGADEVWSQIETNAKAPLYFAEKFYAQPEDKLKFIINVSTTSVHATAHPGVRDRPAYTFSKATSTLLFQLLAQDVSADQVQVVSFHPGLVYSDGWVKIGIPPSDLFDDDDLCGAAAVWLATTEAKFLHGRYIWASWDVDEISSGDIRKRIDEDPYLLRLSIIGL